MIRIVCAALAIAVLAPLARADEFSSGPGPGASAASCEQIYDSVVTSINDARIANDAEARKAKIDCKSDQGCVRAAQERYLAAQRDINKRYAEASARRDQCKQRGASSSGGPSTGAAATGGNAGAAAGKAAGAPRLPQGAIAQGDPDAPDAGAPGFVGSFPGTKTKWGSYCYTYLCESNIWTANPLPNENPQSVGHDSPSPGDAVLVYQKLKGTNYYLPVHFAVYQGNDTYYQRNGSSSIEVVNSQFFSNYPNAILRYVNKSTGK